MLRLTAVRPHAARQLLLHFSDGKCGVFDATSTIAFRTPLSAPLADPEFFACCRIEAGALVWPNGYEISARALHSQLALQGALQRSEPSPARV